MAIYNSVYPVAQNDTYVKATTKYSTDYWAYYATDPTKSLTGGFVGVEWICQNGITTNQRFHIDYGSPVKIKRIYYENHHNSGGDTNQGAENFTLWGSNTAAAFADLTYATDTNWTQLTTAQSTFDQHVAANQADPKYILVTNGNSYRYYALKFADNYGGPSYIGLRRVELQTGPPSSGGIFAWFMNSCWAKHDKLWRNNRLYLPKDLGFQI